MEPITLLLIALLFGAGAAIVIEILSWSTVDEYVLSKSVANGSARIIRKRLESGRYQVVVGVFRPSGSKIVSQSWDAAQLDTTLQTHFGGQDVIQIKT
ncbi:MAG: hypothetical protein JO345_15625 [Streptosporangiaceae bacterium]|nr:hypothetical protein [Streptosporangiaceae bacterium]